MTTGIFFESQYEGCPYSFLQKYQHDIIESAKGLATITLALSTPQPDDAFVVIKAKNWEISYMRNKTFKIITSPLTIH